MAPHGTAAIFLNLFFLLFTLTAGQESGALCKTVGGQDGRCINVLNCPAILSLIRDTPNLLQAPALEQVRQTHCGNFNGVHHVCCEFPIVHPSEEVSNASVEAGTSILLGTTCGDNNADRVANGVNATLSEYPWMALLQYSNDLEMTSFDCGGSLITSQYVLTAAHCIKVPRRKLIAVRLGEHVLSEAVDCKEAQPTKCAPPVQDIPVEEAIYHKDYNSMKFHNDIGLIRLVRKATIGSSVSPICLPVTAFAKATRIRLMIIAGWGKMETGRKADILQKALVTPIGNDECQETFKMLQITENQMCASGENEVDSCKGDSGGPAFYISRYKRGARYIQHGIVSAGVIQCGSKFPGIYVRTLSYLDWIAGNIKP